MQPQRVETARQTMMRMMALSTVSSEKNFCIITPEAIMPIASREPADRSMPPRRITHSIPTAISAMMGT